MAYVPGFEVDVFVSYASADDVDGPPAPWFVSHFVQHLQRALTQRLGGSVIIFRDTQHRWESPGRDVDQRVVEAIRKSAVFLAVLSPSYLKHASSIQELSAFAQRTDASGRIFAVELLPTERGSWPTELRNRNTILLYHQSEDMPRPRRLNPEVQRDMYAERLEDLAGEMAELLRALGRNNEVAQPTPRTTDSPFDVFISYPHQDKSTADAACAMLEAENIRCWIAPRDILPGFDWGEAIVDAIAGAKIMVVIFSRHANASPQIKREVERAVNKGIPIITLRTEDAPLSKSLEYHLSTLHWLDALTPPLERHLKRLVDAARALLKSGISG